MSVSQSGRDSQPSPVLLADSTVGELRELISVHRAPRADATGTSGRNQKSCGVTKSWVEIDGGDSCDLSVWSMQHFAQKVNRCSRAFLEPRDKCLCFNMVEVATQVLARRSPAKLSSWHGTDIARRVAPVGCTSGTGERFRAGGRDDSQSEVLGDTSFLRCPASAVSRDRLAGVHSTARLL